MKRPTKSLRFSLLLAILLGSGAFSEQQEIPNIIARRRIGSAQPRQIKPKLAQPIPLKEDCVSFNPQRAEVKQINGRWKIVEGGGWPIKSHRFNDWPEKGGSRAEERRERKKRDILSPANVL